MLLGIIHTSSLTSKTKKDNINRVHDGVRFLKQVNSHDSMSQPNSDTPVRSYDRSWEEIEDMLQKATDRRDQWKKWFEQCKKDGDRDGMKEAARNHKALDGVIKTLQWTLGEEGIEHPLD